MNCQTASPDTLILPLSKTDVFFESPGQEELTICPMLPELQTQHYTNKVYAENHFVDHMLFRKLKFFFYKNSWQFAFYGSFMLHDQIFLPVSTKNKLID